MAQHFPGMQAAVAFLSSIPMGGEAAFSVTRRPKIGSLNKLYIPLSTKLFPNKTNAMEYSVLFKEVL